MCNGFNYKNEMSDLEFETDLETVICGDERNLTFL